MNADAPTDRPDVRTGAAFTSSWNVGEGSVYTREQFLDSMAPLDMRRTVWVRR
jgi:hypothetical protein